MHSLTVLFLVSVFVQLPQIANIVRTDFEGTIDFQVELGGTGRNPAIVHQKARLYVGPGGQLRLDIWSQNTKDPMVVAVKGGHAWMVAPHHDVVVHGPIDNLDVANPWGRMLSAQVQQLSFWTRDLLNSGLPNIHDDSLTKISAGTVRLSTLDQTYTVSKQAFREVEQAVITHWTSVGKTGSRRSGRLSDFEQIGSSAIPKRSEFMTEYPNGATDKSVYLVSQITCHEPGDAGFEKFFLVPSQDTSFPAIIGKHELSGDGAAEKVIFFSDPEQGIQKEVK